MANANVTAALAAAQEKIARATWDLEKLPPKLELYGLTFDTTALSGALESFGILLELLAQEDR